MLIELFGKCPRVKVIDLFMSHPFSEYSKQDISKYADIARSTLDIFIDELEGYELVKKNMIGNTYRYSANMDSQLTKLISAFQISLADIEIKKHIHSNAVKKEKEIRFIPTNDLNTFEIKQMTAASSSKPEIDLKQVTGVNEKMDLTPSSTTTSIKT